MKIYHVNAFTDKIDGGNPAGVVLNADSLSETEMLEIAKTLGYSETAFVMTSDKADFRLRFFTPSDEVDLCGHATVAAFTVLRETGEISDGTYIQETLAGFLTVNVEATGIFMDQLLPTSYGPVSKETVAASLGLEATDIIGQPMIYSTGLKDIMVHVRDLSVIASIQPDFDAITEISRQYDATGYHVFTLETQGNATAHCRNFAPLYAINEEAATGTASGAVSGYIIDHNLIPALEGINYLKYEQGHEMNRPSEIQGQIIIKNDQITRVVIGGQGLIVKTT